MGRIFLFISVLFFVLELPAQKISPFSQGRGGTGGGSTLAGTLNYIPFYNTTSSLSSTSRLFHFPSNLGVGLNVTDPSMMQEAGSVGFSIYHNQYPVLNIHNDAASFNWIISNLVTPSTPHFVLWEGSPGFGGELFKIQSGTGKTQIGGSGVPDRAFSVVDPIENTGLISTVKITSTNGDPSLTYYRAPSGQPVRKWTTGINNNTLRYVIANYDHIRLQSKNYWQLDTFGNMYVKSLDTDLTPPVTSGETRFVISDNQGMQSTKIITKDTVDNYASLRATAGNRLSDRVVVKDFTYSFAGSTYTTYGGVFVKMSTGTDNGGTILVATDGTIWHRVWDKTHVQPEWWECGGLDENGNDYSDKNTNTNGIYSDSDRFEAALNVGTVVELTGSKTYTIDKTITVPNKKTIRGNGCTIKRIDFAPITLTANIPAPLGGTGSIQVSSTAQLRAGSSITVINNAAQYGGLLKNNSTNQLYTNSVTTISGNTVTLANSGWNGTYVIGNNVYLRLSIFSVSGSATFNAINFDGNVNFFPVEDWNAQYIISSSTNAADNPLIIDNITIKNNSGECLDISAGRITNVYAENCTGSVIHLSGGSIEDAKRGGTIQNITAKNVTKSFDYTTDPYPQLVNHNEAVITVSIGAKNWFIDNVKVDTAISLIGPIDANDGDLYVNNARCENMKYIVYEINGGFVDPAGTKNISITNSYFKNCGMFVAGGGDPIYNLKLNNNTFINAMFLVDKVSNFEFTDNHVLSENNATWTGFDFTLYGLRATAYYGHKAIFRIGNNVIGDFKIENNTFRGFPTVTTEFRHGILFGWDTGTNDTNNNGFETVNANVSVINNKVINYQNGISFNRIMGNTYYKAFKNLTIAGNTVKMNNDQISSSWGIYCPPGAKVYDNTVYGQDNVGEANSCNIYVAGLATTSANIASTPGAHVFNNTIWGNNMIALWVGAGNDDYNCYIYGNNLPIAVSDNSGGNSVITGNNVSTFFNKKVPNF